MIGFLDIYGAGIAPVRFETGMIVRHKQYDYVGMVIAADPSCVAGEHWYRSNRTQPDRDQPWYHVLVCGGEGLCTYVAESNLAVEVGRLSPEFLRDECCRSGCP